MKKGNMVIGQSGGPTVVINRSLMGAVFEAMKSDEIGEIYGALNGIDGILGERFIKFRDFSKEDLEIVMNSPAAALGSCRHKPIQEECEKVFEIFQKMDVRYFFYIGGNDTAETADIINKIARERNYELRIFHIPKTVDNDLCVTDHCPGYGSAARYVALCFMGNDLDNAALPGIKIDIVMGRNAGWLTAGAALGRREEKNGPHLIYVPEKTVSIEEFCDEVLAVYEKRGRAMVAVSEGMRDKSGDLIIKSMLKEQDSHGNVQLSGSGFLGDFLVDKVKKAYDGNLRVRSDTLGYAQRSYPTIYSEPDAKEAFEVGQEAVKYALRGDIDGSVAINRIGEGNDYQVEYFLAKLSDIARITKEIPEEFLTDNRNVSDAYLKYAKPLVGKLPVLKNLSGK